jgi:type III restriction enzyme
LRYYYPDFVVKSETDEMWLVETKGQESLEVAFKDRAAQMWCENAKILTGQQWRYVKVPPNFQRASTEKAVKSGQETLRITGAVFATGN